MRRRLPTGDVGDVGPTGEVEREPVAVHVVPDQLVADDGVPADVDGDGFAQPRGVDAARGPVGLADGAALAESVEDHGVPFGSCSLADKAYHGSARGSQVVLSRRRKRRVQRLRLRLR